MTTLEKAGLKRLVDIVRKTKDQQDLKEAKLPEKRQEDVLDVSSASVFKDILSHLSPHGRV